jgi:hypothetical protein
MNEAAVQFVRRYTRENGTLVWRDEWPGMDGSDDGYESFQNFPLFYALGGSEEVQRLPLEHESGGVPGRVGYSGWEDSAALETGTDRPTARRHARG